MITLSIRISCTPETCRSFPSGSVGVGRLGSPNHHFTPTPNRTVQRSVTRVSLVTLAREQRAVARLSGRPSRALLNKYGDYIHRENERERMDERHTWSHPDRGLNSGLVLPTIIDSPVLLWLLFLLLLLLLSILLIHMFARRSASALDRISFILHPCGEGSGLS